MNNTTNSWDDREAFWLTIYKYVDIEDRPVIRKLIISLLRDTEREARAECIEIIKSRWLSSSSMKDEILSALSKE